MHSRRPNDRIRPGLRSSGTCTLEGDLGSTKHGEISRLPWRGKSIAHKGDNKNVSGDPVERMTSRKVGPDFLIWRRTTGKSGENEDS